MGEENVENNISQKQEKPFKIIKGQFKYGKYDDETGMFMGILGNEKLKSWNLIMSDNPEDQLTAVDGDYIVFKRIFSDNTVKEKQRSYKFKEQLREQIEDSTQELLTATLAEIEDFFNQELHSITKEKIKLEVGVEEVAEEEIKENFPQLFIIEDNEGEEDDDEDTILDCSLLIAPISGKRLGQIDVGDEILLETSAANRNLINEEIPEIITAEDKLLGRILEIKYDEEDQTYQFLVMFSEEILGQAIIDANANMKLAVPGQKQQIDLEAYEHIYKQIVNFLLIVLAATVALSVIFYLL
ncbi:MAG: hypothetical protein ACQERJ_08515 [Bacillota bacterium]